MKIFLPFAFFFLFNVSFSNIIENNINYTFVLGGSYDFDINQDGVIDFTFIEQAGSIAVNFNPDNLNFIGTGTIDSGHGWDIIKFLGPGIVINNSSLFTGLGDAYINPSWVNSNEIFPNGISFIGFKIKLNGNFHYGWIKVSSLDNVLTIISHAYEDVVGQSIVTQTSLSISEVKTTDYDSVLYPCPFKNFIYIESEVDNLFVYSSLGEIMFKKEKFQGMLDTSNLINGVYFFKIINDSKIKFFKMIKS